jgi:Tol biopolymer transport system component
MAQPFDPATFEFTAEAVSIAEQVIFAPAYARGSFSAAQNGNLILQSGDNQIQRSAVFDIAGNRTRLLKDLNAVQPRFSSDGKNILFAIMDLTSRNGDVWKNELSRGTSSRLTFHPAVDIIPVWSPSGDSLVFQSNRNGVYDLFIKSTNGTGEEHLLVQSNRNKSVHDWSLDGKYIIFGSGGDPKTKNDLWILPMSGDRKPISFLQTEFNEMFGTFSPDSRWVVYQSDETGRAEIYARLLDGSGGKFQITTNGGRKPQWRTDTKKIYFSSMDRKLQIAYVNPGVSTFVVDSIRTFFDFESRGIVGNTISDVSYDGKQFLAVITESKQTSAPITLAVNWNEELKKK